MSAAFRVTVKKVDVEERRRSKRIVEVAWGDESLRRVGRVREFYVGTGML